MLNITSRAPRDKAAADDLAGDRFGISDRPEFRIGFVEHPRRAFSCAGKG
jgi:hypothetical protein